MIIASSKLSIRSFFFIHLHFSPFAFTSPSAKSAAAQTCSETCDREFNMPVSRAFIFFGSVIAAWSRTGDQISLPSWGLDFDLIFHFWGAAHIVRSSCVPPSGYERAAQLRDRLHSFALFSCGGNQYSAVFLFHTHNDSGKCQLMLRRRSGKNVWLPAYVDR